MASFVPYKHCNPFHVICLLSIPLENIKKSVFWCFPGVKRETGRLPDKYLLYYWSLGLLIYLFLLEILSIILILICYHLLTKGIHCVKYAKIRVPLARTFPYKDRITLSAKYGLEKNRNYYAINNKKDTRISPLTLKRSTATKWSHTL